MKRRKSAQREKIYQIISSRGDHPTAAQIFEDLHQRSASASMGNMYRNLRILVEEGRVTPRVFEDGIEHFDAITAPHYHFICQVCGSISDFPMDLRKDLEEAAQALSGRTITGHSVQFFGLCTLCEKNRG